MQATKVLSRVCPTVVVVLGATGAGKSKLALDIATRINSEIINADSMQVYKGLDIITNKVTADELEACPHHVIDYVNPLSRYTVVDFRDKAIPIIDNLLKNNKVPIIVGGTNYYIEALLWNILLDPLKISKEDLLIDRKGDEKTRIRIYKRSLPPDNDVRQNAMHNEVPKNIIQSKSGSSSSVYDDNDKDTTNEDRTSLNTWKQECGKQKKLKTSVDAITVSSKIGDNNLFLESTSDPFFSGDNTSLVTQNVTDSASEKKCWNTKEAAQTMSNDKIAEDNCDSFLADDNFVSLSHNVTESVPAMSNDRIPEDVCDSFLADNNSPLLSQNVTDSTSDKMCLNTKQDITTSATLNQNISYDTTGGSFANTGVSTLDQDMSVDVEKLSSDQLHKILKDVDPVMADKLHPNNRRKIIRSLQVFEQYRIPHSQLLTNQQAAEGGGPLGGPLRYSNICVLWVQTNQTVLDERLDKRVDGMLERGLLQELSNFHTEYNQRRVHGNVLKGELYSQGIFQSIGFKEFHDYLVLPEDERVKEIGLKLKEQGIEKMKQVTRRYARKQLRWINNRFLQRPGPNVPPVYGLDASDPTKWNEAVFEPAMRILTDLLEGRMPSIEPLASEKRSKADLDVTFTCDKCSDRIIVGHQQWQAHMKSRGHLKRARKLRKKEVMSKYINREVESTEEV